MDLKQALQTIGLNDKQAAVYTALLQLGQASAYAIATKSSLKKPTTYVILDELIDKGLAVRLARTKVQQYAAISPEMAFGLAEERLEQAKRKLPELLALTKGQKTKVNTLYFEGWEGIKQMAEYRLQEHQGEEMLAFWAKAPEMDPRLTEYFVNEWPEKMQAANISLRGFAPDDPSLATYRKADARYRRQIKPLPSKDYDSEIALVVLRNMVRIEDYKNLQGVVLENREVAKAVRQIFEMLWKRSE